MAIKKVPQSAANAAPGSAIHELVARWNDLLEKLDADFTAQNAAVAASQLDVDFKSTLGIEFEETGEPVAS